MILLDRGVCCAEMCVGCRIENGGWLEVSPRTGDPPCVVRVFK
jgi:hypothetical protein